MSKLLVVALCCTLGGGALAGENPPRTGPVSFTKKPMAAKAGPQATVSFAVSRETDVAVFVENAKGEIIRHLVAGVLGKNPPPPLKPDSLEQTVPWDGKADYGRPATGGPYKFRVAIGLGAKFDKILAHEPEACGPVNALGVGPDGTAYVLYTFGNLGPGWPSQTLVAFNRDGTYQRTLQPYPAGLKTEEVKGLGVAELNGKPVPVVKSYTGRDMWLPQGLFKGGLAVTKAGQVLYVLRGLRLAAIGIDGGLPFGDFGGPFPFGKSTHTFHGQKIHLAVSSDDTSVYMSAAHHCSNEASTGTLDNPYPALFKVKLPGRTPAQIVFGDMKATGDDQSHFGGLPSGVALDGKGNILVGDPANKRVVVISEKGGKFVSSFAVEGADCIAADPATGAVYVTRVKGRSIDLAKFQNGKEVAKAVLPSTIQAEFPWIMSGDFSARPPVLWLGGSYGDRGELVRVEDNGNGFGEVRKVNTDRLRGATFMDLSVEHVTQTVTVKGGPGYFRYDESTDKLSTFTAEAFHGAHQLCAAPDGNLFTLSWSTPGVLRRHDRNGKQIPWEGGGKETKLFVAMNIFPHTFGVRPSDGRVFVFEPAQETYKSNMKLVEIGPDGKKAAGPSLIARVSPSNLGPKFDAQGYVYIADQVRPAGKSAPPELGEVANGLYGSILKFSPAHAGKGAGVHFSRAEGVLNDAGLKTESPDPSLKRIDAVLHYSAFKSTVPASVVGAEWMYFGISHVEIGGCTCENTRFDVDEFGRVFFADLCRYRVGVLDTAGNEIAFFGGYGNAESMGSESPVIDPKTRKPRPRRADDPKDLKSPFADPDLGFAWLLGVGATDKHLYTADIMNRRFMRSRLTYAAEEACAAP